MLPNKTAEAKIPIVEPNKMYEKLGVDSLHIQVGDALLPIADPALQGPLHGKIGKLRLQLTDELGYIIPKIRILDSLTLHSHEYAFFVRSLLVAKGKVYPEHGMIRASHFREQGLALPQNAIQDKSLIYPLEEVIYWLPTPEIPDTLQKHAMDAVDVIIAHIQQETIRHVDKILTFLDVLKLMEMVRQHCQTIVNDMVPHLLTPIELRKIFVNLIREQVCLRDIVFVFESLLEHSRSSQDPDVLSERVRFELSRQICLKHANDAHQLAVIELSKQWENQFVDYLKANPSGARSSISSTQADKLIQGVSKKLDAISQNPQETQVILCLSAIRLPLFRFLTFQFPTLAIIAYDELIPDITVKSLGTI